MTTEEKKVLNPGPVVGGLYRHKHQTGIFLVTSVKRWGLRFWRVEMFLTEKDGSTSNWADRYALYEWTYLFERLA